MDGAGGAWWSGSSPGPHTGRISLSKFISGIDLDAAGVKVL